MTWFVKVSVRQVHLDPQDCDVSGLAYVEVFGVNLTMFGQVVVLLGHEHPLPEEVLVDSLAVGFGDEPGNLVSMNNVPQLR